MKILPKVFGIFEMRNYYYHMLCYSSQNDHLGFYTYNVSAIVLSSLLQLFVFIPINHLKILTQTLNSIHWSRFISFHAQGRQLIALIHLGVTCLFLLLTFQHYHIQGLNSQLPENPISCNQCLKSLFVSWTIL